MSESTGSAKADQLHSGSERSDETQLTTNQGVQVPDDRSTLRAGARGPALLEDHLFREKMTHFDHERIPERVVHPRGSGAHGYFQVYASMAERTKAAFLQDPSVRTPVFVRFSTVVGFRGSADTARDVRGFATKFYTSEGNFDLVANNMPVFFIQDALKFPDLVHSIKPEPHNEMPQATAAHDTFWDFATLSPESTHMLLWVLSDRGLPRSYRMMEGFGVHTFRWVNAEGQTCLVKWHWKPVLGAHSLVWDEAQKLGGKDPDYHRRDLWEAIEGGDHVEFELGVQIVEEADADAYGFDLLDPTKLLPEELVPVQRIGKMVLDRNPDNFFSETEQVAFHPGHLVPGIDVTNDPLLQGRLFSYLDTQLLRLGGPNFTEIPINRPVGCVHNNQRDGFMRQTVHKGRVSYYPNSLADGDPAPAPDDAAAFTTVPEPTGERKVRAVPDSFTDHFTQARLFWHSQSPVEQDHIVSAAHFELGKVEHLHIRQRLVDLFSHVDRELAEKVAAGIGVREITGDLSYLEDVMTTPVRLVEGVAEPGRAPSLSLQHSKGSARTRKVGVLVADGVSGADVEAVRSALQDAGAKAVLVGEVLGAVRTAEGEELEVDKTHLTSGSVHVDALLVPGGEPAVQAMLRQGQARHAVLAAYKHAKPLCAIGAGVELLRDVALPGVRMAEEAGEIVVDTGIVTAGVDADRAQVGQRLVEALAAHRHWGRASKDTVPA